MTTATKVQSNITIGGISFSMSRDVIGEGLIAFERLIPAAQAATLTVRATNLTTGTATMTSGGHTISTGSRIDIYWSGGSRRGVTVGTVSGTSVPFSGGSGDNLPVTTTALTIANPVVIPASFLGNKLQGLFLGAPQAKSTFVLASAGPTEEFAQVIPSGGMYAWDTNSLVTNPVAGDTITAVYVSHNDSGGSKKLQFAAAVNV